MFIVTVEVLYYDLLGSQSVGEGVEAELRAVSLGLVAVINDPVHQSRVGVVL